MCVRIVDKENVMVKRQGMYFISFILFQLIMLSVLIVHFSFTLANNSQNCVTIDVYAKSHEQTIDQFFFLGRNKRERRRYLQLGQVSADVDTIGMTLRKIFKILI